MENQNNSFEEIWEKLKSCKKVIMILHLGPDGDSLGSCSAMKKALERFSVEVKLISYDSLAENFKTFDFVKEIEFGKDISEFNLSDYDAMIFLDCGSLEMVSLKLRKEVKIPDNSFIINIDHHETNNYYGNLNYIDKRAVSTCSVLIDFFNANNVEIDKELANRLLLGVVTDSVFFTVSSSEKALKETEFLISRGASYIDIILKPILYNEPLKLKKYGALLINNLRIDERGFGYTFAKNEDIKNLELNSAEVKLGIHQLKSIREFKFVFDLIELDEFIKGDFRTNKNIDVSAFAKELGGGGHKQAAGFFLPKMPLEEAREKVFQVIEKVGINIED